MTNESRERDSMSDQEHGKVPEIMTLNLSKAEIEDIVWCIRQTLHSKTRGRILGTCLNDSCDWCKGQLALIEGLKFPTALGES